MTSFIEIADGTLRLNLHPGQTRVWDSDKRFIFMLAGTQSGKTEFAAWWLKREIERCGDGDYFAVSPTYPLQRKKVLPVYLNLFCDLLDIGTYRASDRILQLNRKGFNSKIFFASADNPDSLESATAKAAHLDECGQDSFRLRAWEAIRRRLSIHRGRVLATTTLYNLGWMKSTIYDRWERGDRDFDVVQFPSISNPAFPKEEYEDARKTLPTWKFKMFYRGEYDRPAGMIYDCFDEKVYVVPPRPIPETWRKYAGMDFGANNTAAVYYAEEPGTGNLYLYRVYLDGGKTAEEHAKDLQETGIVRWIGGAKSEKQWRWEFNDAGIPLEPPVIHDVEVGINRVYGMHQAGHIYVFDTCQMYLDEKGSYARVLDADGEPTEKIKDKNKYHILDAERYIMSYLAEQKGITGNLEETASATKENQWNIRQHSTRGSRWRM